MQIIEEQVVLNGENFTRTEIEEIASFCDLATDGVNYVLKKFDTLIVSPSLKRRVPMQVVIRQSKPLQKALKAHLFVVIDMKKPIITTTDLRQAIDRYKSITA